MSSTPSPEHARIPQKLSDTELRQALEELDSKIKTLRNRAHTTTAGAPHTYHEHIAALEVKRNKLAERLGPVPDNHATDHNQSTWSEIWHGIENLRNDLRNII